MRAALLALCALLALTAAAPAHAQKAKIKRTGYGIPHISAKSYAGIALGYAYALA
jgi:acyl-homoserine lactone acylase PvdQ